MENKRNFFNASAFKRKVYFLCLLFTIDIILNSFTQFLAFGNKLSTTEYNLNYVVRPVADSYFLFCFQLLVQLLMLFTALSLFWNTFYFQLGMVGKVCSRFKYSFLLIALYPIFFITERVVRLIFLSINRDLNYSDINIWSDGFYFAMYILKYLIGFIYYIYLLDATLELGKSKYYKPDTSLMSGDKKNKKRVNQENSV